LAAARRPIGPLVAGEHPKVVPEMVGHQSVQPLMPGSTYSPALSADGRYVAFVSTATNLTPGDINDRPDIYVYDLNYDLNSESIELLSRTPSGKAGNGASSRPAISEEQSICGLGEYSSSNRLVVSRRDTPIEAARPFGCHAFCASTLHRSSRSEA
jgi:hypothetical protein